MNALEYQKLLFKSKWVKVYQYTEGYEPVVAPRGFRNLQTDVTFFAVEIEI